MKDIQAFARRIAKEFKPKRIILFGSYAYGKPTRDSDVDLLIIMPYKGRPTDVSLSIRNRMHPGFPIDLFVYSPAELRRRMAQEDFFLTEIVEKGMVLHES
ncbi:MAG: nucleotidyltransferase domain-containing protein [Planctomycetes bacterium]|nr:nucleotidyltransferase domain-containing protein [Planctomycetota bacterium]